jgi:hypothetical protein
MAFRIPILKMAWTAVALGALAAGGLLGYRLMRADIAAEVYRERLEGLARDYESIRSSYNAAVKRTAVNELVVRDGRVFVRVRNVAGTVKEVETPFDPSREIYVDYVVVDGRLWLRRVFDSATAPGEGLVIDPALADIDWHSPSAKEGKAVYRRLSEGRWIVTVTGDGSLGLARAEGEVETPLAAPPEVRDYEQMEKDARTQIGRIGAGEVWRRLVRGE